MIMKVFLSVERLKCKHVFSVLAKPPAHCSSAIA